MSTFPEGYGLGPGPRHPFQTYICNRCGAVVTSKELHDKWHAQFDIGSTDAEVISRYQTMQRGFAAKHFDFPPNPAFEERFTAPDGSRWQWTDELQWELRRYPPDPAETPDPGPWRTVADIPEAWDRFEDRFGDQWRRRYSPSGEQIWEVYSFPNFCWIPVPLRDGCAPFYPATRQEL